MSLVNALKAFVNPPDDVSNTATQQSQSSQSDESQTTTDDTTTDDSSESANSDKPVKLTGGSSDSNTTGESTETESTESVDNELQEYEGEDAPATPDDADASVQPKAQVEGEYWPYMVEPTDTTTVSNYEIEQFGYPITEDGVDDELDIFMGEWPRSMIESRGLKDEPTTWIGYQDDPVKKVDAGGIGYEYLFRHSTIFGETGQGKTTLLMNMMLQWIYAGYGCCFIDPKGAGDAKELVQRIPPNRIDDVIWIEPGSNREKMIGFNLLETDADPGDKDFIPEVEAVVKQFKEVIKNTEGSSGAIINEVTEEVTRHLVKDEYNYNVLDLYAILFNEEDRDKLPELETDQFGKLALESVAEKEEDQLESIKRRVRPWVTDVTTRDILDVRDTGVNLTRAIEDGKIMIVKTSKIPNDDVVKMFVTALVRRIWSTINRRDEDKKYDPYFLVVDEFDDVNVDRMGIGEILGKARAFNFSVTLATQQPSSLDDEIAPEVFKNSKNVFTFTPGNHEDARTLSNELGDELDATALKNLEDYSIAGKIMANREQHTVILNSFAPYPPLHTPEKAEEIIQYSLERYGKEHDSTEWDDEQIFEKYGLRDNLEEDGEADEELVDINNDVSITVSEFLRCVFLTQVKKPTRSFDGEDGYIQLSDLEEILDKRYGGVEYNDADHIAAEKIGDNLLDKKMDSEFFLKLTDEGEALAFEQDTGSSGSSGKAEHRRVLATAWKEFTRIGYDMDLPKQEDWGEDPPDGIASPPIKPFEDADNPAEFEELQTILQSEYPRLYDLFESNTVAIEAETSTLDKPKQTIKNLAKAIDRDQKCVLVTKERTKKPYKEDPYENSTPTEVLEKNAKQVYNIFQNPPFVRSMDEDGNRTFYNLNSNKRIDLRGGGAALQKKTDADTIWREDGNKVILENGNEDDTVSFRKAKKIHEEPLPSNFNYYYEKDKSSNLIIVKNSKQEVVEEYDTVTQMQEDGWERITPPLIPESIFDAEGKDADWIPSTEDWMIMAKPRASNPEYDSEKLYIYNPDATNTDDLFEPLVQDEDDATESDDNPTISAPSVNSGQSDTSKPSSNKPSSTNTEPDKKDSSEAESPTADDMKEEDGITDTETPSDTDTNTEDVSDETDSSTLNEKESEDEDDSDDPFSDYKNDDATVSKPSEGSTEVETDKPTTDEEADSKPNKPMTNDSDSQTDTDEETEKPTEKPQQDNEKPQQDKPKKPSTSSQKPTEKPTTNSTSDESESNAQDSENKKPTTSSTEEKPTESSSEDDDTGTVNESDSNQPDDTEKSDSDDDDDNNNDDNDDGNDNDDDDEVWGDPDSITVDL